MSNQATPLGMDGFSRYMADIYNERDVMNVSTGFQAIFGNPQGAGRTLFSPDSEVVDIDILRGNRKTAALVRRGQDLRRISGKKDAVGENYSSYTRKFPLMEEETPIGANKILQRIPGENPYERRSRIDRMRWYAREAHLEHMRRMVRANERLAASSALNGSHPAIFGATSSDLVYDFDRSSGNTITVSTAWDAASPDILGDIDDACEAVRANGKHTPDCILIGEGAFEAFISDTTVKETADNRRFELIMVSVNNPVPPALMRYVESGMIARGSIGTPAGYKLWVFTYLDSYETDAGTDTKYMPTGEALVWSSKARADRYFGPAEALPLDDATRQMYVSMFGFSPEMPPMPANVKNMSAVINPAAFYCDAYQSEGRKNIVIRSQSAPIFATTATDGFAKLTGLLT